MGKATHTPGPWYVDYYEGRAYTCRYVLSTDMNTAVAKVLHKRPEAAEDAALIAAAPDLLEAIKYAREYLGGLDSGGPVLLGLCCLLDDAISKAEGPGDAEGLV